MISYWLKCSFYLKRIEYDEGVPEGVIAVVDGDKGQGPAEAHQQSKVGEHGEERDLLTENKRVMALYTCAAATEAGNMNQWVSLCHWTPLQNVADYRHHIPSLTKCSKAEPNLLLWLSFYHPLRVIRLSVSERNSAWPRWSWKFCLPLYLIRQKVPLRDGTSCSLGIVFCAIL